MNDTLWLNKTNPNNKQEEGGANAEFKGRWTVWG